MQSDAQQATAIIIRNKKLCLVPTIVGYTLPSCDIAQAEDPHTVIREHIKETFGLENIRVTPLAIYSGPRTIHYFIIESLDSMTNVDPKMKWYDSSKSTEGSVRVLDRQFSPIFLRLKEKGFVN